MSRPRLPRALRELAGANAGKGVDFTKATRHWEIRKCGTLIGIYPLTPAKEGFAENTKSQLRQAGLTVEGRSR